MQKDNEVSFISCVLVRVLIDRFSAFLIKKAKQQFDKMAAVIAAKQITNNGLSVGVKKNLPNSFVY